MIPQFIASIYEHFKSQLGNALWIENNTRTDKEVDIYELRTSGPNKKFQGGSQIDYIIYVQIQVKFKQDNTRPHKIFDALATAMNAFPRCIQIKNYPTDNSVIGTAILENGLVETTNMGMFDAVAKIACYTVDAAYKLENT